MVFLLEIQILPTPQPNRILIHKPIRMRLIIPEEVVMQPRLMVAILVFSGGRDGIRYLLPWFPLRSGTPVRRERRFSRGRLKSKNRVHNAHTLTLILKVS